MILESVFHIETFNLASVAMAMGTGLLLGIIIALVYKACNIPTGKFAVILAVLPMLVTAVIMIVNGSLGASVAVLGAFGLVRFRSAAGGSAEIGYIFFAMAAGLAAGMGYLTLAILVTCLVALTLIILEKIGFAEPIVADRTLKITIPESLNYTGLFDDLFKLYTKYTHLECVRTTGMGTLYELSYRLRLKDPKKEKAFIDDLRCRNGNLDVLLGQAQTVANQL